MYLPFFMVVFLIFDGGKLADIVLVAEFDISIIDIDEWCFLVGPEEHVLAIIVDPLEWLYAVVVEIRRADVCSAVISTSQVFLKQEMVSGSDVVVLIGLNAALSVFHIKVELFQLGKNELVHRNAMVADNDAAVERNVVNLFAPLVVVDLLDLVAFAWVDVQNPLEEIFEGLAYETWKNVLA